MEWIIVRIFLAFDIFLIVMLVREIIGYYGDIRREPMPELSTPLSKDKDTDSLRWE